MFTEDAVIKWYGMKQFFVSLLAGGGYFAC